jgi:hypothetical protein
MGRSTFMIVAFFPLAFCSLAHAMYFDSTNGYYYESIDTPGTWSQQQVAASEETYTDPQGTLLYGRLAVISDQDVENAVFYVLPEADLNLAIGLYDPTDTGHFQWVTGDPITYGGPDTPNPTQPSDFPEGQNNFGGEWEYGAPSLVSGQDYVAFSVSTAPWGGAPFWAWNTFGASDELDGAIIEFTPTPDYVPEPASLVMLSAVGVLGLRRPSTKLA